MFIFYAYEKLTILTRFLIEITMYCFQQKHLLIPAI